MKSMTTKADFYILPGSDEDSRYQFLNKLMIRVLSAGHKVYIHTDSEAQAQLVADRLWQAPAEMFLPNQLPEESLHAPISLGWLSNHLPSEPDLLVNLSQVTPDKTYDFNRISEIIIQDETVLAITRQRFKDYKTANIEAKMHDMRRGN